MAITQTQIVDYLNKKVGYGVAKTDTSTAKYPFNESIASPLLVPGATVLQQDYAIPNVSSAPSANTVVNGTTVVSVYNTSTSAVVQGTSLSESISNETWSTGITNWIPPSFGSGYQLKVYAGPSGASAATAAQYTQLPVAGSGNSDSWFFDYQSGILNFADTNVPTAVSGNVVYFFGAVYTGALGITNYANLNVTGNLTSTNGNINLTNGNIVLTNGTYYGNFAGTIVGTTATANVAYYDVITPLSNNQNYYLEFANISTSGNSITGVNSGLNYNPSSGNLTASTMVAANMYASTIGNTGATLTGTTVTVTNGSITTLQATNFSTGNARITGGYADNFPIGANVSAPATFTTVQTNSTFTSCGAVQAFSGISSTSTSTGALQVQGGAGITGNIYVGGNAKITGNLEVDGTLTYINTTTEIVSGIEVVAGNLVANSGTASSSTTTGALVVAGGVGISGAAYIGGSVFSANSATGFFSNINNTPIGSLTPSTGAFTTATTSGTLIASGNVVAASGTASSSTTTGALVVVGGLGISGAVNTGSTITASGVITSNGNLVAASGTASSSTTTGALVVVGGAGISGNVYVGNLITSGSSGNISGVNTLFATNVITSNLNVSTSATFSGTTTFSTITTGALQAQAIGNVTPGTGAFTTLTSSGITTSNGNLVAASGTASTTTTSGALVVVGGMGISGTISSGGAINTSGIVTLTNSTNGANGTGALVVQNGGAYIAGNLYVGGNINLSTTTINQITGNSGSFFGNAAGFGALYTGIPSGYVVDPQTVTQETANFNGYAGVVTGQNLNSGSLSSADIFLSPDNGTYNDTYLDMGIGSSTYNYSGYSLIHANDGYLFVQGNSTTQGGNLIVGTGAANDIVFTVQGINTNNEVMRITRANTVVIKSTTSATNTTSGALQVAGGVGIQGALYAGSIQNTPISGSTGYFTTAQATNLSTANAVITGGYVSGLSNVSATYMTTTNLSTANAVISGGYISSMSNIFATYGTFTYSAPTNFSTANAVISGGYISGVSNITATTANITNLTTSNINVFGGALNNVVIGNVSTASASFTTLNASGVSTLTGNIVTGVTTSTSTTTGALVIPFAGGAGIGGNLNVGGITNLIGNVVFGGTPSTSTTTGAIVVGGGVGIAGNAYIAGNIILGSALNYVPANAPMQIGFNINNFSQFAIQNANGGNNASTDIAAVANNGSDNDTYIDMGITSSNYSQAAYSLYNPNDGYLIVSGNTTSGGGNLILNTYQKNDIIFATGGTYANAEVARFHGNTTTSGYFVVKTGTNNTLSANTGALQVWGGASVSGNTFTGGSSYQMGGALFNHNQASAGTTGGNNNNAFIMQGVNDSTLIYAKPLSAYDAVIIGGNGASTSFAQGAKLVINSTDSILLPTGTNSQRPGSSGGTDTTGMLRFNTTGGAIEWYNGTSWQTASTSFTVIADQQFNGDGSTVAFTLSSSQTTASCIVSINGVVQIPTLAYSVSGTTLTFTEAPAPGDVIDVREITTTSTVLGLADASGYNTVNVVTGTGITFTTGTSSQTIQYTIGTSGAIVTNGSNVTVASAGTSVIDNLFANAYSSAKYTITAVIQNTNIREVTEVLMVHNGDGTSVTTATVATYGRVNTAGNTLVTYGATTTGNIAQLQATTTNANTILRIKRDYMAL